MKPIDKDKIKRVELLESTLLKYKNKPEMITLAKIVKYSVNSIRDDLRDYEDSLREENRLAEDNIAELREKELVERSARTYRINQIGILDSKIRTNEVILNKIPGEIKKIVERGNKLYDKQAPRNEKGYREIDSQCYLMQGKCIYNQTSGILCSQIGEGEFPTCDHYVEEARKFIQNGVKKDLGINENTPTIVIPKDKSI